MKRKRHILVAAGLLVAACASPHPHAVGTTPAGHEIVQIPLTWSNAFLIRSTPPTLIDAGAGTNLRELQSALEAQQVELEDIGLVILTHGHADHTGLAAELQRRGARVVLGEGDAGLAQRGANGPVPPMGLIARLLGLFVPKQYEAFAPNVRVTAELDLTPEGLAATVVPMPGHTAGSIAVLLPNHAAFVGDLVLGGSWGGRLSPHEPGEHYFHDDAEANRRQLEALLARGVETFYLGHGGPVRRADVLRAFALAEPQGPTHGG